MKNQYRFLIKNFTFKNKEIIEEESILFQLTKVLKVKPGQEIIIFNGKGKEAVFIIKETKEKVSLGKIKEQIVLQKEKEFIIYLPILKGEKFYFALEKITEIGVNKIVPTITERTIKKNINLKRAEKIIKEATEQSWQYFLPQILPPKNLEEVLDLSKENDINFLLHPSGKKIKEINSIKSNKIGIFVGPEGDFTPKEIEKMEKLGFQKISLGENILKSETAAIVSLFYLKNL